MKSSNASANQKGVRRKEMNVIFFVDSSRTRSFSVSLSTVRIACAAGATICLWTFASIWIIASMTSERGELNVRLSQLLTTIFDYQARYDGVYENAYPTAPDRPSNAANDAIAAKGTPDGQSLAAKPLLTNEKLAAVAVSKKPDTTATKDVVSGIEIDDPTFSEAQQNLVVDFAIKNLTPDKRATGVVWAIARLRSPQGQDIYVGQPPSIDVDAAGTARHTERATKFTIRRFKPVSVQFPRPVGQLGSFQDVRISVVDENGKKQDYKFPVELTTNTARLTVPGKGISTEKMSEKDSLDDMPGKGPDASNEAPVGISN